MENALIGRIIITAIIVIISNNIIIMLFLLETSNEPSDAVQQGNFGNLFPMHSQRMLWVELA